MQQHRVSLVLLTLIYSNVFHLRNKIINLKIRSIGLSNYIHNYKFKNYVLRSPVKTCKAYIPKRPRFEEPISSSSGSSNGDFDGGYFPSGKFTNFGIDDLIR